MSVVRPTSQSAVAEAVRRFGRLDCIFNNAGFGGVGGRIEAIDIAGFDQTIGVLLRGVLLGMKHAAPVMKRQGGGSIISTASVAGLTAGFGPHVYSAAKAAVIQLTQDGGDGAGRAQHPRELHLPRRHRHADLRQGAGHVG